ncbi:diguanylate cyclase domain-containing protein [Salinisphaera sp. RV14]|uniref:diguanylate cyclase domain-containing protein n=1 Tax=Salinisphaera sp. RV14 TaxID=3454140 RepID=UPI003F8434B6
MPHKRSGCEAGVMNYSDLLLDALCIVDAQGCIVSASPACERIFGYTPAELAGRQILDLVIPEDRERTREIAQRIMNGALQPHFENRYRRKDGSIAHIMWSARWSEADQVRVGLARDITQLKQAESRQTAIYAISEAAHAAGDLTDLLRRIHAIIDELLGTPNFLVALYDAEDDSVTFPYHVDEPESAAPIGPLAPDSLIAEVIRSGRELLVTPDLRAGLPAHLQAAAECEARYWLGVPLAASQGPIGVLVIKSHGDSSIYGDTERALLQFVSTQIASAIERKQMLDRMQRMAQYDPLTGLVSRGFFHERFKTLLGAACNGGRNMALLYLDLDRFKPINDLHGHGAGDRVLRLAAKRLLRCVRESDIVARYGGDEFVVLLRGSDHVDQAESVAGAIRRVLSQPFFLGGKRVTLGVSIGIAIYPQHGPNEQSLLNHADAAMYRDKKAR